jgi:hypothetical protein
MDLKGCVVNMLLQLQCLELGLAPVGGGDRLDGVTGCECTVGNLCVPINQSCSDQKSLLIPCWHRRLLELSGFGTSYTSRWA